MKKFNNNPRKINFIEQFPETSIGSSDIQKRCKFNFSFFDDSQEHGTSFSALENGVLANIIEKIKSYTHNDLNYWRNQRCGSKGLKILADYDSFPVKSSFTFPKFVPNDVNWCRFRMENFSRLIGFTIPATYADKTPPGHPTYDPNTFYLVFIDLEHKFYPTNTR